jgi:nitrogen regulatory protein PII
LVGTSHALIFEQLAELRVGQTRVLKMKRIELVIDPGTLDRFREAAKGLDLSDFEVTEVRRTLPAGVRERQRLYRGREFVLDLVERLKIDLMVADDAAMQIARELVESVRPESMAILKVEHAFVVSTQAAVRSPRIAAVPTPSALAATH